MVTCKDCSSFTIDDTYPDRGNCSLMLDYNNVMDRGEKFMDDRVYAQDVSFAEAWTVVGINFGCIHFDKG